MSTELSPSLIFLSPPLSLYISPSTGWCVQPCAARPCAHTGCMVTFNPVPSLPLVSIYSSLWILGSQGSQALGVPLPPGIVKGWTSVLPSTGRVRWEPFFFQLERFSCVFKSSFPGNKGKRRARELCHKPGGKESEQAENIKSDLRKGGKNHLVTCTLKIVLVLICFF